MNFHSELFPKPLPVKINHRDKLLLLGSCFTQEIGNKLSTCKFSVLENPNGILFNPVSISNSLISYTSCRSYADKDLFYYNELWGSWNHHTKFSSIDKSVALSNINNSQQKASRFVKEADWVLITLGSAFVYEHNQFSYAEPFSNVVANCHKVPADKFNRRLLNNDEISRSLVSMISSVKQINPGARFIFTVSPVRHLREGFIENNRSKAVLIQAVHSVVNETDTFYFPAYELVIDDLRDYRFYAEDMVHPNYAATNYVWEKFIKSCIDETSQQLMKKIATVVAAINHKPFNPASEQHKKFLKQHAEKVAKLTSEFPYINFTEELKYFSR